MIVFAGLRIVARYAFPQEDRADFAVLDQALQISIHRGETYPRQLFANPTVDLVGEGMAGVALESLEDSL
jgi:hypothetical protein